MLTRRPEGDDGTTLAELVVCMCLTTMIGAIALGFFVWTGKATRATTVNSFANQNARTALTTAAGLLRLTVPGSVTPGPVASGLSTTVSFAASDTARANCARRPAANIALTVASGTLTMTRTGPVENPGPTTPCNYRVNVMTSRVIATGVQDGTGFAFDYRTVNGSVSTDPTQIGSIDLTLVVKDPIGRAQTYTATAIVSGGGA